MLPIIIDGGVTALLLVLFITQILLPILNEAPLFPVFRGQPRNARVKPSCVAREPADTSRDDRLSS